MNLMRISLHFNLSYLGKVCFDIRHKRARSLFYTFKPKSVEPLLFKRSNLFEFSSILILIDGINDYKCLHE